MWDECNCVLAFFGIAFLWDWNENWPFPVLWPLLSFPNLLAYWVQHFLLSSSLEKHSVPSWWHQILTKPFVKWVLHGIEPPPFTKTLHIGFQLLLLWSSLSELSEMLPPRLQSSFCPKWNLTLKLYIFFSWQTHGLVRGVKAGFQAPHTASAGCVVKCTTCATVHVSLAELYDLQGQFLSTFKRHPGRTELASHPRGWASSI